MDNNIPDKPVTAVIKQNLLDKAIAYVMPGVAMKRMVHRSQLALSGGYAGAKVDRAQLSRWQPTAGSANADIICDLPTLRARSRDQMRNASVALGALNTMVNHVIGTGLSYNPVIDAKFLRLTEDQKETWQQDVKRRFMAWAESADCDIGRNLDFYGIQELAFRSHLESGDCFVLVVKAAH